MAKRYSMAIEMCLQHKVTIQEDMVEKLTPPEGKQLLNTSLAAYAYYDEGAMEATDRKEALKNLGKALRDQGSFVLGIFNPTLILKLQFNIS